MSRRVIITGASGSGKSTLGAALAVRLGVPFVELDALFWGPGWSEPDPGVFQERVSRATASDGWVVAGNYFSRTQEITWPRAQTVVFLDHELGLNLRRVIVRSWRRYKSGELLWGGENREGFWKHLTPTDDSLIWWVLATHRPYRQMFRRQCRDPRWRHLQFVRLGSPGAGQRWLEGVPGNSGGFR